MAKKPAPRKQKKSVKVQDLAAKKNPKGGISMEGGERQGGPGTKAPKPGIIDGGINN